MKRGGERVGKKRRTENKTILLRFVVLDASQRTFILSLFSVRACARFPLVFPEAAIAKARTASLLNLLLLLLL